MPFFGRTAMIELQFVKSVVNCGLCRLEAIWEFFVVSFEDGSLVRFFPNIVGLHRRASLASSRIECVWRAAVPAPCATLVSFRKEPSPKRARRKDVKSNKDIVLAFQRAILFIFVRYRTPKNWRTRTPSSPNNNPFSVERNVLPRIEPKRISCGEWHWVTGSEAKGTVTLAPGRTLQLFRSDPGAS